MPNRGLHNRFARMLGIDPRLANAVNADMDAPAKVLGPGHRRVRHDTPYALQEAAKYGNPQAFIAAEAHILLDGLTKDPATRRALKMIEAITD